MSVCVSQCECAGVCWSVLCFLYFTLLCCGSATVCHCRRAACVPRRAFAGFGSFAQIAAICCCFSKLLCLFRVRVRRLLLLLLLLSLQLFMIIDCWPVHLTSPTSLACPPCLKHSPSLTPIPLDSLCLWHAKADGATLEMRAAH